MAIKPVDKGPYDISVDDALPVILSITIGNAQLGGNVLELNGKVIGKGSIKDFPVGLGKDLKGKSLKITTNVLDVNPSSNRISITHAFYLTRAIDIFQYPEAGDDPGVDNDGDVYSLVAKYNFI